jgi:hypothetical protein
MANFEPIEQLAKPFDPSDGALSDAEKLRAATDFSQLIEDTYLAHIADLNPHSDNLRINIQDSTSEGRYISHLEITIYTSEQFGGEKRIQIMEYHKAYRPKTRVSIYSLKADGSQVSRFDEIHDVRQVTEEEFHNPDHSMEATLEGLRSMVEESDNLKLEKDLGYNDQPIDSDEVGKLRNLILG